VRLQLIKKRPASLEAAGKNELKVLWQVKKRVNGIERSMAPLHIRPEDYKIVLRLCHFITSVLYNV
jgi:hypothetical protein